MGMRALAVDAEAVEGCGMARGEVAVGAAAREGIDELEADLGGQRLGVLEQRGAGVALLVRRPVQLAGDLHTDAFAARFHVEDFRHQSRRQSAIVGTRRSTSA